MLSKELIPLPASAVPHEAGNIPQTHDQFAAKGERLIGVGAQRGDYTLIFNRHATPEDAAESVALIGPDSLVFLEGFMGDGGSSTFHEPLSTLMDIRASLGTSSPEYRQYKQEIVNFCARGMELPARGPSDFWHHKCTQIGLLLDKDCVVQFADYLRPDLADDKAAAARTHRMFLNSKRNDDEPEWWEDLRQRGSIGRAIIRLNAEVANKARFHTLREIHAVDNTLLLTGYLAENPQALGLATNDAGKLKAYGVYGTAHAKSLQQQFTRLGVDPQVRMVKPDELPEYLYIDPVITMSAWQDQNSRQRAAHEVVTLLIDNYDDSAAHEELIAEAYEHLAPFNTTNKEAWLQFLATAVMTVRDAARKDPQAYSKYQSLLRMFMAEPQRFV